MALIYVCDNCGAQKVIKPIVGNEFEYIELGFGSLKITVEGKRDLCKPCMALANAAFVSATGETYKSIATAAWDAVKKALAS